MVTPTKFLSLDHAIKVGWSLLYKLIRINKMVGPEGLDRGRPGPNAARFDLPIMIGGHRTGVGQ